MEERVRKVNKLAYLGLLGLILGLVGILLALYTRDSKWLGSCGFFGLLGFLRGEQA